MLETQPIGDQPRLWATIREAIAGSHHGEYTEGPIGRAILLLAIPMVLELRARVGVRGRRRLLRLAPRAPMRSRPSA